MKFNIGRQKLLSVVLAVVVMLSSLYLNVFAVTPPYATDIQTLKDSFANLYITKHTGAFYGNDFGTLNGKIEAATPDTVFANDNKNMLSENFSCFNLASGGGIWPRLNEGSEVTNLYNEYLVDDSGNPYTDAVFYLYTGTVTGNGAFQIQYRDSINYGTIYYTNSVSLTAEMSNQWIRISLKDVDGVASLDDLSNVGRLWLYKESTLSATGMYLSDLIVVKKAPISVAGLNDFEVYEKAKNIDYDSYSGTEALIAAKQKLDENSDFQKGYLDYLAEKLNTEISELEIGKHTGVFYGNEFSGVGNITAATPDTAFANDNKNMLSGNFSCFNLTGGGGIWPRLNNGGEVTNLFNEYLVDDSGNPYTDAVFYLYTGTVTGNGAFQIQYRDSINYGTIYYTNSVSLTAEMSNQWIRISLKDVDGVASLDDLSNVGRLWLYKESTLSATGMYLSDLIVITGNETAIDYSSVVELYTKAKALDKSKYINTSEFDAVVYALKEQIKLIYGEEAIYDDCEDEVNELKAAWVTLERKGEPEIVQWRAIKGGTIGGAITDASMPELSASEKEKVGDYAAAFNIDDVGTGTGNAWILQCPVIPGALSLDNYSDMYQWIYSGDVTSIGQKAKIVWEFKNTAGEIKTVIDKEYEMESNTWYCIKISDFYDSMDGLIAKVGSSELSEVRFGVHNKPFTANGMIYGTIFAIEKQNLNLPTSISKDAAAAEWLYMAEQVDINSYNNTERFHTALKNLRKAINDHYKLAENVLIKRLNNLWTNNTEIKNVKRIAGITETVVKDGYTVAKTSVRNNVEDFNGLPLGTDQSVLGKYYSTATFPSLRYFIFRDTENNGNQFNVSLEGYNCLYFYIYADNVTAGGTLDAVALNMNWTFLAEPKIEITPEMSNKWVRICISGGTVDQMFTGESDENLASLQIYNTAGSILADKLYISDLFVGNMETLEIPSNLDLSSSAEDWATAAESVPEYNTNSDFILATAALRTFFTDRGKSLISLKYAWEELDATSLPGGFTPDDAGAIIRTAKALDLSQYEGNSKAEAFAAAIETAEEYYKVNISVNVKGIGSVEGDGIYYIGETATLNAVTTEGNEFGGWFENDNIIKYANNEYKFIVSGDRSLELLYLKGLTFIDEDSGISVKINRLNSTDAYEGVDRIIAEKHTLNTEAKEFADKYGFEVLSAYKIKLVDKNGKIVNDIGGRTVTVTYNVPDSVKSGITNLVSLSDGVKLCDCNYYEKELVYTCEYDDMIFTLLKLK